QKKNSQHFFELIHDCKETVNTLFFTVFKTFEKYRPYITNALELDDSNAKLEATNKLIKDIKRQGFGYRNFPNFKKRIYLILNSKKERTNWVLSRT
ncbi:transposase, partial [Streptococcus devriesei]